MSSHMSMARTEKRVQSDDRSECALVYAASAVESRETRLITCKARLLHSNN